MPVTMVCPEKLISRQSVKGHDMSQHNLVSAQNHVEAMVASLTANVYITCRQLVTTLASIVLVLIPTFVR